MSIENLLRQALMDAIGDHDNLDSYSPVSGGDINESFLVTAGEQHFFVKTNRDRHALDMFQQEVFGLKTLKSHSALTVPTPYKAGSHGGQAYLIMEALRFGGNPHWQALGQGLADLHRVTSQDYGLEEDNYIGTTKQQNKQESEWPSFWWTHRLLPQFALANAHRQAFEPLMPKLKAQVWQYLDHKPAASLVHGDLWSGNAGFLVDGSPCIYDPAIYYGDREVDIALTQLFGGYPKAFYDAYTQAWPLPAGFDKRKKIYNLYHVLNHLNLFGSGYLAQSLKYIRDINNL